MIDNAIYSKKCCTACKQIKDLSEFGRDKYRPDGQNIRCKECARDKSRMAMQTKRATPEGRQSSNASARRWTERKRSTPEGCELLNCGNRTAEQKRRKNPDYLLRQRERKREGKNRKRATREGRERLNEIRRLFDKNHPDKANAKAARRRAAKLKAIPPWADRVAISAIYENCPSEYHVDHIVPLRGDNVCGLHTQENLQYLPAIDNCRKGNRTEGLNA